MGGLNASKEFFYDGVMNRRSQRQHPAANCHIELQLFKNPKILEVLDSRGGGGCDLFRVLFASRK